MTLLNVCNSREQMDEETSGRDTFDKSGGWGGVAKEEITYVDRSTL